MTDITDRKRAEMQPLWSAFLDDLTGIANRALLVDRVGRCLERHQRQPSSMFAIVLVDLDQFRVVNDGLGHEAGDGFLRDIARRLAEEARGADTVPRLSGDELARLLEDIVDPMDATQVALRLGDKLSQP